MATKSELRQKTMDRIFPLQLLLGSFNQLEVVLTLKLKKKKSSQKSHLLLEAYFHTESCNMGL